MWRQGEFYIATEREWLDITVIHGFIANESYWGQGRDRATQEAAIAHSALCFGVYVDDDGARRQIGFARLVSDMTFFAYVADVLILPEYRGRGLGKWLIQTIQEHPVVRQLRRVVLFTATPGFYTPAGFDVFAQPAEGSVFMQWRP